MIHLGDITKISGYSVPIVDVVVGGSPCQDLSAAGKRAGLAGDRSGLFMEQLRIIKEMRENDKRNGRTDEFIRPRYMVWENVPGAFSSNKAEDFRIVLEKTAKVADKNASIPMPEKGKWTTSGCIVGDGWSIAWRVLNAQFWGVPQRRRRIALVADFGGQSAPEILFVCKSVSGDTQSSQPQRNNTSSYVERGVGADHYNAAILGDTISTLGVNCGMSHGRQCILMPKSLSFHLQQDPITSDEITPCLGSGNSKNGQASIGVVRCVGTVGALCARDYKGVSTQYVNEGKIVVEQTQGAVSYWDEGQIVGTLTANNASGCQRMPDKKNFNCVLQVVGTHYMARRLTPLECERLQGYPDGWTDIGEWVDSKGKVHKTSDAARYKALGATIALPPWKWVMKRLCACYERNATLASLFDGIGGFPLIWEQINGKGSCLWASEIDEFPIAVTKKRIGG